MIISNLQIKIPTIALVNNPVPVRISCDQNCNIIMHIWYSGTMIYESSYYVPLLIKIDISEILRTIVSAQDKPDPEYFQYSNNTQLVNYQIKIYEATDNNLLFEKYVLAMWGGFSNKFIRNYSGINYIEDKVTSGALVLSTRSSGEFFVMRESEISSLQFLTRQNNFRIVSPSGNQLYLENSSPSSADDYKICTVNLKTIRKKFFLNYDELPAYLSFIISEYFNFQIVFTPAHFSNSPYILRFCNSLGSYEQIEITGKVELSPEFESDNGIEVSLWDDNIMDYVNSSGRKKYETIIIAEAGYKNKDELLFIQDLLSSHDIYLLDPSGIKSKIMVSTENFKILLHVLEQASITLKIKFADTESNYSSDQKNLSLENYTGEWFLNRGYINAQGFIYSSSTITL